MPEPEDNTTKSDTTVKPEEAQSQPVRELTQTDHLNKKLLTSLFNRMNEGGNSALAKMLQPDEDDSSVDEEWKD